MNNYLTNNNRSRFRPLLMVAKLCKKWIFDIIGCFIYEIQQHIQYQNEIVDDKHCCNHKKFMYWRSDPWNEQGFALSNN